jgi:hypothetical protein
MTLSSGNEDDRAGLALQSISSTIERKASHARPGPRADLRVEPSQYFAERHALPAALES